MFYYFFSILLDFELRRRMYGFYSNCFFYCLKFFLRTVSRERMLAWSRHALCSGASSYILSILLFDTISKQSENWKKRWNYRSGYGQCFVFFESSKYNISLDVTYNCLTIFIRFNSYNNLLVSLASVFWIRRFIIAFKFKIKNKSLKSLSTCLFIK